MRHSTDALIAALDDAVQGKGLGVDVRDAIAARLRAIDAVEMPQWDTPTRPVNAWCHRCGGVFPPSCS